MFGKLLKHDLKASAPLMLILSGITLIVSGMGAVALRLFITNAEQILSNDAAIWIAFPCMLLFYVAYFGLIIYVAAAQYIQLFRFYGSRFTDRGYLTFTLPVSAHCNFLSAAVNMLIWLGVAFGVFLFGFCLMMFGGLSEVTQLTAEDFSSSVATSSESFPWGMNLAVLFVVAVSPVYSVILSMSAVVTACSVFKRLKVLGCIGFLYAFEMVAGFVISSIMLISMLPPVIAGNDPIPTMTVGYTIAGVVMVLLSVGGYFLSVHLMQKKLNLA